MDDRTLDSSEFSLTRVQVASWLILAVLVAVGWALATPAIAKGIVVGGVLANLSFLLLKRDLQRILAGPGDVAKVRFFIKYYARLTVLAFLLFLLVQYRLVHVIGLLVGLSTILLSIVGMVAVTAKRMYILSKEAA